MKLWTKEQKTFLGLNPKEARLLEVLHTHGALNTSALAYQAKIPRVTVMRVLKNLKLRGFVRREGSLNEVLWFSIGQDIFIDTFIKLSGENISKEKKINLSEVGSLQIFRGEDAMLLSNEKLLKAHAGERLLAIEPNGVWKHFAKVSSDAWADFNVLLGKQKILAEVIFEEGFEKNIKTALPALQESFFSIIKDMRVVPRGFLDSSTEILIFRDQVLFMDWAHLVAIEIKDPSLTRVIKAMYRSLQESGRLVQIR